MPERHSRTFRLTLTHDYTEVLGYIKIGADDEVFHFFLSFIVLDCSQGIVNYFINYAYSHFALYTVDILYIWKLFYLYLQENISKYTWNQWTLSAFNQMNTLELRELLYSLKH